MIQATAEQLREIYDLHLKIIDKFITDRKDKVHTMLDALGENYVLSPASGKTWYHGAYPGGYLVHVNTVVRLALEQKKLFEKLGGTIDFTDEELVFAALFHDLGKLGDGEKANYIPQTSDWARNNKQELYISNPELDFMLVPDRSLFILQKFGIPVDQKEYLGIKLHDGMFEESNKAYYVSFNPNSKLKTNLVPILHAADYLASKIEFDLEQKNKQ
jgi:hypothetical protein